MSVCLSVDIHSDTLRPEAERAVLTVEPGVCKDRSGDESYALHSQTVNVSFAKLNTRLSGLSCISLIANTRTTNTAPMIHFYDGNITEIGRIVLTLTHVNITIREESASFNFTSPQGRLEYVHIQLCVVENRLHFYSECEFVESKPFETAGFSDSDVVGLLKDIADSGAPAYEVCIHVHESPLLDSALGV